ncbi:hypothetical protein [Polaromonas sp.]|uniref:hypothetical protein n=1 Tax=Polaromonas sp. TaxID=1869339 RepID=UPI0035616E37
MTLSHLLQRRRLRSALVLYLGPEQTRLIRVDGDQSLCLAESDGAAPAGNPVASALVAMAAELRAPVCVVLGCPDQRFAYDPLASSYRVGPALNYQLQMRFPEADLRAADAVKIGGVQTSRTTGASHWPELQAWLAWLGDMDLAMDGPFLLAGLLVDALQLAQAGSLTPADARSSTIVLIREPDGGAWILGLEQGKVQLVRQVGAALCGGSEPQLRASALAAELTRSRDWLLAQEHGTGEAPLLVALDDARVCALLSQALDWPVDDAVLHTPSRRFRLKAPVAWRSLDTLLLAALSQGRLARPVEPAQWAPRRRVARRSQLVATLATLVLVAGLSMLGWRGWTTWQEHTALQQAGEQLQQQQAATAVRKQLGEKRSAELSRLAAGKDVQAFEQQALAYRDALPPADTDPAMERLVNAAAQAMGRSAARTQSVQLSWDAKSKTPSLTLSMLLPPGAGRNAALGEVRQVAALLQSALDGYKVTVTGLDRLSDAAAAGPAAGVADGKGLVTLKAERQP